MMLFLYKVIQDPRILPRLLLEKERMGKIASEDTDKRRKIMISSTAASSSSSSELAMSSSSVRIEDDQDCNDATPMLLPN